VKDGIQCELVKLHTVNKKKPTKKFVGRKRKTAEKKGEEHHQITARGLRNPLGAWKLDGVLGGYEAIGLSLLHLPLLYSRVHPIGREVHILSLGHDVLGSKVLHAHLQSTPGSSMQKNRDAKISNGDGSREEELVNSKNPTLPFIYLLGEGTWAEKWRQERKRQPTNGQEK
jgi:hypothetical protein